MMMTDSGWDTKPEWSLPEGTSLSRLRRQRPRELRSCGWVLLMVVLLIVVWAISVGS